MAADSNDNITNFSLHRSSIRPMLHGSGMLTYIFEPKTNENRVAGFYKYLKSLYEFWLETDYAEHNKGQMGLHITAYKDPVRCIVPKSIIYNTCSKIKTPATYKKLMTRTTREGPAW